MCLTEVYMTAFVCSFLNARTLLMLFLHLLVILQVQQLFASFFSLEALIFSVIHVII